MLPIFSFTSRGRPKALIYGNKSLLHAGSVEGLNYNLERFTKGDKLYRILFQYKLQENLIALLQRGRKHGQHESSKECIGE